jgi:hypothetical protein
VQRHWKVHRLVLSAFAGKRPDEMECRHHNGVRTDNRLENLQWGTRQENIDDQMRHGTYQRGDRNGKARLTCETARVAYSLYRTRRYSALMLAEKFGVSIATIHGLIHRRQWNHLGLPPIRPEEFKAIEEANRRRRWQWYHRRKQS